MFERFLCYIQHLLSFCSFEQISEVLQLCSCVEQLCSIEKMLWKYLVIGSLPTVLLILKSNHFFTAIESKS